ncbi:MAG: hypothetical protein U9N04_01150 [Patescibacteria group bacterium]|nr:hypothetical protein [Patescibacteria group bacterium]
MKIKITPFSPKQKNAKGEFRLDGYYYLAEYHSAGMILKIKKNDNFNKSEMWWVTRTEIPFITAIRHSQLNGQYLTPRTSPIIRRDGPLFIIKDVEKFPSTNECRQLIYKYCDLCTDDAYDFLSKKISKNKIKKNLANFDYNEDLIIRAGSCLYKAYILLETSSTYAEEIYVNIYIALEAIIEHLNIKNNFKKEETLLFLEKQLSDLNVCQEFEKYEFEMRESIRNNIIHPYRRKSKVSNPNVFLMADYVFEDLPLVDLLFFHLLNGAFYINVKS